MLQTLTDGTTAPLTWFRLIPAIIFVETTFMDQVSEATCYFPVKTSFSSKKFNVVPMMKLLDFYIFFRHPLVTSYIIFFGITILQKLLVRKW